MKKSLVRLVALLAVATTACTSLVGETPTETAAENGSQPTGNVPSPTTTLAPRVCEPDISISNDIDTGSLGGDAAALAIGVYPCAHVAVLTTSNTTDLAVATQLAAAVGGPLLIESEDAREALEQLAPDLTYVVGQVTPEPQITTGVAHLNSVAAAELTRRRLEVEDTTKVSEEDEGLVVAAVLEAVRTGSGVVLPVPDNPDDVIVVEASVGAGPSVMVVDHNQSAHQLLAASYATSTGSQLVSIDVSSPLDSGQATRSVAAAESALLVGPTEEIGEWERSVLARGDEVAGGGFTILPNEPRRYVAFYGHPTTPALGVLGEQAPDDVLERMAPLLAEYEADGVKTVPAFEIIASIASAEAGNDGNYSRKTSVETLLPLVETAEANETLVLLDLQPGRQDFLTQAMFYEELLMRPFVGLALDPEWRLKPDQVHLRQIGTVDAEEVNTVINWLADLVRDNGLPQKMLLLHMFRNSMITNRDLLVDRPELQVVIQMDGNGTEGAKDGTYAALMRDFEDAFWSWGWKNFFDEDIPGPPTPASTSSKEPAPVFISYQ